MGTSDEDRVSSCGNFILLETELFNFSVSLLLEFLPSVCLGGRNIFSARSFRSFWLLSGSAGRLEDEQGIRMQKAMGCLGAKLVKWLPLTDVRILAS